MRGPLRVVAGGDRLGGGGEREQGVAAAVGRGAGVRRAAVRGHVDRAGRLAADDDAVDAVRRLLAGLEAQARVPAGEALHVGQVAVRHSSSQTSSSAVSA